MNIVVKLYAVITVTLIGLILAGGASGKIKLNRDGKPFFLIISTLFLMAIHNMSEVFND